MNPAPSAPPPQSSGTESTEQPWLRHAALRLRRRRRVVCAAELYSLIFYVSLDLIQSSWFTLKARCWTNIWPECGAKRRGETTDRSHELTYLYGYDYNPTCPHTQSVHHYSVASYTSFIYFHHPHVSVCYVRVWLVLNGYHFDLLVFILLLPLSLPTI